MKILLLTIWLYYYSVPSICVVFIFQTISVLGGRWDRSRLPVVDMCMCHLSLRPQGCCQSAPRCPHMTFWRTVERWNPFSLPLRWFGVDFSLCKLGLKNLQTKGITQEDRDKQLPLARFQRNSEVEANRRVKERAIWLETEVLFKTQEARGWLHCYFFSLKSYRLLASFTHITLNSREVWIHKGNSQKIIWLEGAKLSRPDSGTDTE